MLHWAKRDDEAVDQCLNTIERLPDFPLSYYYLAHVYAHNGLRHEAIAAAEKAVSITSEVEPGFAPLRADLRFGELMRGMNLVNEI